MQLRTHIAFGLFFGALLAYIFNNLGGAGFMLLCGLTAFLPDIDWAMQFKWKWGKAAEKFSIRVGELHRTVLHNIWAMLIIGFLAYYIFNSWILFFGIVVGFLSHLAADSLTVTGVHWLWPYGKDESNNFKKGYLKGPLNMDLDSEKKLESRIKYVLLAVAGFLFLAAGLVIDIFSLSGVIIVIVLLAVGYVLLKKFDDMITTIIRKLGI